MEDEGGVGKVPETACEQFEITFFGMFFDCQLCLSRSFLVIRLLLCLLFATVSHGCVAGLS